jgi:hypothetical protein
MNRSDDRQAALVRTSTSYLSRAVSEGLAERGLRDLQTAEHVHGVLESKQVVKLPRIVPHVWTGPDDVAGGLPPGCFFCGESNPAQYGKSCPKRTCNTWYEVLGVPDGADENQINTAYRELVKKWDPERLQDPDEIAFDGGYSKTQMKWFNAAYAVLGHPAKRQQYDAERLLDRVDESRER